MDYMDFTWDYMDFTLDYTEIYASDWLVRSSVSSVMRERSSWEFINVGPIFDFGKKCRNRNTTTTTPTFLSGGHFDLGTFRLYTQ